MNSILEKFGIYDLLAVLLPGICICTFSLIILQVDNTILQRIHTALNETQIDKIHINETLTFLTISYFVGLIFQEFGSLIQRKLINKHNRIYLKVIQSCESNQMSLEDSRMHLTAEEWNKIRPLAKLGKAVKIADASNQGKAKCETVSAVTIAFREDTKSFDKADSVFNKDTYFRNLAVIFALLLGQRMILGTLFRQKRIGVYQGKALVSGICLQHRFCLDMDTRILE